MKTGPAGGVAPGLNDFQSKIMGLTELTVNRQFCQPLVLGAARLLYKHRYNGDCDDRQDRGQHDGAGQRIGLQTVLFGAHHGQVAAGHGD